MTVSYVRSPSFSAHNTFTDFSTSPPQSPNASCASSTSSSPVIGFSSPRAAPRALGTSVSAAAASASALRSTSRLPTSTSAPVALGLLADATSIVVPNDRMEAGLSLRRSPLLVSNDFESEQTTSDNTTAFLEDLDSEDVRYEPAFTGDIDHQDRFVYRRPYVDRALAHSKRRSQLIFEQKFQQHRSAAASELDSPQPSSNSSPRAISRLRRPGTAPQRASASPHTPESAPAHLDFANRAVITSSGGLRELTTGAAAQPASKRASWLRRTREFEAYSDSHHPHSSGGLEAAASITSSTPASRRHSSFLTGDYRSATLMPVLSSQSFEVASQKAQKRRSGIIYKSSSPVFNSTGSPILVASSGLVGAGSSKRDSMLSTDSSATSSSKDERRSVDNVEFDGDDALHQAHSSASSRSGHEESPATKPSTWHSQTDAGTESKVAEVFTTPRSSAEHEKAADSNQTESPSKPNSIKDDSSASTQQAAEPARGDADAQAATPVEQIADSSVDSDLVPAPAIVPSMLGQVVPPTPPTPGWVPPAGDSVSPTSSPVKAFRSLAADESPRKALSSRSQTSLDSKLSTSPATPFGTLPIPNGKANGSGLLLAGSGRRGSSASIGSAISSTSTYRIRRKPVPSDADESERRPSATSGSYSDAAEASSQQSPAQESAPLPHSDEAGVRTIQHTRSPSGSDFIRMAQEAAQARMFEKGANGARGLPAKSSKRPSTTATASGGPGAFGLGIGKALQTSASSRELSAANGLSSGAPSTPVNGAAPSIASRTPSRATIKRPTTAPVGSGGQFRVASDAAQKSVLEVEGMQFVLDKDEPKTGTTLQDSSPSIPNAVRFLQHQRVGSNGGDSASMGKRDSLLDAKRKSASINDSNRSDGASVRTGSIRANAGRNGTAGAVSASSAGGWGLEQELNIVDRVREAPNTTGAKPRPASMDKSKKAQDAAVKANIKNTMLMNIINEDESDEVKAAAREAGIPEGSYAIHPPSMLQLFEASQCLVYNQQGQEVIFGDLFKKRRTLVCFLRHWWCGFCQQFAMSIRNIDPLPLKKANLDFVIIGQGDWHVIKAYREVMQVPYPMYADPKRNVYRALGMTLRTNDANPVCARPDYASMSMTKGILVAIKKGLFDMPIRNPGDMKLLGGDFILGPGLQCSFTHRMTTADGHMDLPRILAQAGCDLSLKTPKPLFTVEEKEARAAMLAGGNQNRRQTRSLGRSRGKKSSKTDAAMTDTSFGSASGSAAAASNAAGSTNSRFARPSLWGRFPGRFSKSQVSLPTSGSMADLSTDFGPARGLSAGPRSASAMRKISYDGRVRDSFETQQTDIEFESRATSFDTRGGRPSDVSAPAAISSLNKAQSMAELRRRFEMGSAPGLSGLRTQSRHEPSAAKLSLEQHLTVPGAGRETLHHSASSKSLRAAANGSSNGRSNGAATPTQQAATSSKQVDATAGKIGQKGPKPLSIFPNNIVARSNGLVAPAATGLGIATAGDSSTDGVVGSSTGDRTMVDDAATATSKTAATPVPVSDLSAPGSFLMDLDVYDSLSRQPSQKYYGKSAKVNGKLGAGSVDSGLSPSQFSDGGFSQEAAEADSDTEPSMSATQSPARSQRTTASSSSGSLGPSNSNSFYSFNTFRGKTNLEHLVEEADEDESDEPREEASQRGEEEDDSEEENDEPIEFEDGRNGLF